jgi:hypothetical protein
MSVRNGLLGLAGLLAAVAVATAKPPELPGDPLPQGREPTPVARELFEPDVPAPSLGALRAVPVRPLLPTGGCAAVMGDVVAELQESAFDRVTFPLGTVPVRREE